MLNTQNKVQGSPMTTSVSFWLLIIIFYPDVPADILMSHPYFRLHGGVDTNPYSPERLVMLAFPA